LTDCNKALCEGKIQAKLAKKAKAAAKPPKKMGRTEMKATKGLNQDEQDQRFRDTEGWKLHKDPAVALAPFPFVGPAHGPKNIPEGITTPLQIFTLFWGELYPAVLHPTLTRSSLNLLRL
jgi:hypothetical protein